MSKSIRSILVEHHNGVMEIVEASNTGQITGVQEDELAKNNTDQALADIKELLEGGAVEYYVWALRLEKLYKHPEQAIPLEALDKIIGGDDE